MFGRWIFQQPVFSFGDSSSCINVILLCTFEYRSRVQSPESAPCAPYDVVSSLHYLVKVSYVKPFICLAAQESRWYLYLYVSMQTAASLPYILVCSCARTSVNCRQTAWRYLLFISRAHMRHVCTHQQRCVRRVCALKHLE